MSVQKFSLYEKIFQKKLTKRGHRTHSFVPLSLPQRISPFISPFQHSPSSSPFINSFQHSLSPSPSHLAFPSLNIQDNIHPQPTESPPLESVLAQYIFVKGIKQKLTSKSIGPRDGRRKQLLFPDFPKSVFCSLFPQTEKTRNGHLMTLMSTEQIEDTFGVIEKKFLDGSVGYLIPPFTITYSLKNRLRFIFYYELKDPKGQIVNWVLLHAQANDARET
jgi:hypothetical protein